jgi:replicative DNA helicase
MDLIERLPPQNLEAEASVLGSILIDNEAAWAVLQFLKPEHFYRSANQRLFEIVKGQVEKGKPVDLLILKDLLGRAGELEEVGGVGYLQQLLEAVPTSANAEYYARLVVDRARLRSLIHVASDVIKDAYDTEDDATDVIDRAEKTFFEVTARRVENAARSIEQLIHEEFDKIDAGRSMTGLHTQLVDLDHMTNGLKPSELVILAARPSMGKTSLATTILRNVAVQERRPVLMFSLEMSANQVAQNMLCSHARVDSFKMRRGQLDQSEIHRLRDGASELTEAPIYIDDASGLTVMELRARARMMAIKHDVELIMIDYLQLIEGDARRKQSNRQEEISRISRGLKALARELNVPVVSLSQLSRAVEQREGHRPRLSDLRESGSIEQDADMVWLLFREAYYKPDKPEIQNLAELIVAKNRNGPTGNVQMFFHREYTRFDNHLGA